MATMTMNKAIHAAVRRDLQRLRDAGTGFTDGDRDRASALGMAWDNFDEQLTHHHEGEHEIAWPAMLQVGMTQAQLDEFDAEHATMAAALSAARLAMAPFRTSGSRVDADAFTAAVTELQQVTVSHLDHEEAASEELMLANADHPAIKEMGRKFGKVPPTQAGWFFAWVLDGASPEERAGVEDYVPKPVLMIIGGLFGRGYRRHVAPVWGA